MRLLAAKSRRYGALTFYRILCDRMYTSRSVLSNGYGNVVSNVLPAQSSAGTLGIGTSPASRVEKSDRD